MILVYFLFHVIYFIEKCYELDIVKFYIDLFAEYCIIKLSNINCHKNTLNKQFNLLYDS